MKLRFKNWKIKNKILMSLITIMIFFLFIIFQSYNAVIDFTANKIPLILSNDAINTKLLEMRTHEKDFLMYEDFTSGIYDHRSIYLDEFEKSYSDLIDNLNQVKKNSDIQNNPDMISRLTVIEETVAEYHDNFKKVVDKINQQGSNYDSTESIYEDYQSIAAKLSPMITDFHHSIMEMLEQQVTFLIKIVIIATLLV